MSKSTITSENFNADNLVVTAPKKNKKKKLAGYINFKGKNCNFETRQGLTPFGVSSYTNEQGGVSWSITISAKSKDEDDDVAINDYFDKWVKFDEKMLKYGIENSKMINWKRN